MKTLIYTLVLSFMATALLAQNNEQANNNNKFAFDIRKTLISTSENVFISPYSISSALAMTYLGAKNNTKTVMEKTMYFNKNTAKSFKLLNKTMKTYNDSNLTLDIANALWIDKNLKLKYFFKRRNKKYFESAVYPKTNAKKINKWASDNTNNKIKNIVDDNDVASSKLILTNAVYFNAEWKYPFITKSTKKDKFTTVENKVVTVNMMYHKEKYKYFENKGLQAIELPYKGDKLSMIVIMPKTNISNFNINNYTDVLNGLKKEKIKFYMPKFEFESSFKLKDALSELGMKEAFTPTADYSGISKQKLFISNVIHKTYIGVNEKGTEAAAVTAVLMRTTSVAPHPIKEFKVNRPFIVIIKDTETNSILFIGNIVNPNL